MDNQLNDTHWICNFFFKWGKKINLQNIHFIELMTHKTVLPKIQKINSWTSINVSKTHLISKLPIWKKNNTGGNSTNAFGTLGNGNCFRVISGETSCSMSNLKALEEIMVPDGWQSCWCEQEGLSFVFFSSVPLESLTYMSG